MVDFFNTCEETHNNILISKAKLDIDGLFYQSAGIAPSCVSKEVFSRIDSSFE